MEQQEVINRLDLATLERVDPRSVWADEAADFTPWLAENIEMLGRALGVAFDQVSPEEPVGRYNVDLWGRAGDKDVVIENQLTESNHDHLGKLLTYGSYFDAGILVWIAPAFTDEHLSALNWLNQASVGHHYYLAVQVEVYKIAGSSPAPLFRVIVQPPDWGKRGIRRAPSGPSERQQAYHAFFEGLLNKLKATAPQITRMRQVQYDSWLSLPTGRTGFSIGWSFARGQRFRVELYIDTGERGRNKAAFDTLYSQLEEIESQIGAPLSWERLEDARASRIALYTDGSIDYMQEKLQELSEWAISKLLVFQDVFAARVRVL